MFNLVKNELVKIFSKKGIYIILAIYLIITIAVLIIESYIDNSYTTDNSYMDERISDIKQQLNEIDTSTDGGKYEKVYLQTELEILELQNKYGGNSWQSIIVSEQLNDTITNINYYKNGLNDSVDDADLTLEQLQAKYDDMIKKLDVNDWKYFAQNELQDYKQKLELCESMLKDTSNASEANDIKKEIDLTKIQIQKLEWRIEKDICYGDEKFDMLLQLYDNYGNSLIDMNYNYDINENTYKEKETKEFDYETKVRYQEQLANFNIAKYKIENGIATSYDSLSNTLQSLFTSSGMAILFTIIITLMLTSTIISEEFNKGTIKLLLVRPYGRRKILLAKIIACVIAIIISIVIITAIEVIFSGFEYGFNTINTPAIVYNYNTNTVIEINVIKYMLMNLLKISPMIIILFALCLTIATITASPAVSIVISFLAYFSSDIIKAFAVNPKLGWLKIFPTINWDLTQYGYGKLSVIKGMNLETSIIICAITVIVLVVFTFEFFARKDVKNI